jgi:hypothetical protein
MFSVSGGPANTYQYDADGRRIHRVTQSFTGEYVYDFQGRHIGDMMPGGSIRLEEIYAGSRHLATYNMGYDEDGSQDVPWPSYTRRDVKRDGSYGNKETLL